MIELSNKYLAQKAVIYARVSSKEQHEEGHSIPAQLKLLKSYASDRSRQMRLATKEFTDVETAKVAGRTEFSKMVQFLKDNKDVRHLLVEKTDRLYRNFKDYIILEELDLVIHLVKEGEILSKDAGSHSKFIHGIKLLMAKNYIDNLSEEVIKGMDQKASEGSWPCRPPLGYVRNTETHMIEIDIERAPLVLRLFQEYGTNTCSLSQLVTVAREIGLRSTKGNQLSKAAIHRILTNLIYTGNFMYKGQRIEGVHEKIVHISLFQRVQSLLRNGTAGKRTKHDMAFRGLVKCGVCGGSMTPDIKKGRFIYYRCTNYNNICRNVVTEKVIAEQFGTAVRKIQISQTDVDALRIALKESRQKKEEFAVDSISNLTKQYGKIKQRMERAYEDKLDGLITNDFWKSKSKSWNEELNDIEVSISKHREANENYLDTGSQIIDLAGQAYDLFTQQTNHERRKLIQFIISHSTFAEGTLCVTYRKPFDLFANGDETEIKRG